MKAAAKAKGKKEPKPEKEKEPQTSKARRPGAFRGLSGPFGAFPFSLC